MQSTNISSYKGEYLRAEMCYGASCKTIEIPWVHNFALLPKLADAAVLDDPSGKWPPGLYVRFDQKQWRPALSFEDVCHLSITANRIRIVVMATATEVLEDGWNVFKNSQKQDVATIQPSTWDIWVAVLQESEFIGGVVTKELNSASANVLQVSGGADRTVKDWLPTTTGFVTVGIDGIPVVRKINLGEDLPEDINSDAGLTSKGLLAILEDKPNEMTDAVSRSISVNPDLILGDGSATAPFDLELATGDKLGVVKLATTAQFPAPTNDTLAVTPAFVQAMLDAMPDAFED